MLDLRLDCFSFNPIVLPSEPMLYLIEGDLKLLNLGKNLEKMLPLFGDFSSS